jgi:hypothetical protein
MKLEQLEMFEVDPYHFYEYNRSMKVYIVAYDKTSPWSGAIYSEKEKARGFADYCASKTGNKI